jgi:SAM-dependent methyltransferase
MSSGMKETIKRAAPWRARRFARRAAADLASLPRRLCAEGPLPWRVLHDSGGGDYHQIGRALLAEIVRMTGAAPTASVLDVGCGDGRCALAFADWLAPEGRYLGFDVSRRAVAFCRRTLSARRPDFRFEHADVFNGEYNAGGRLLARDFVFPLEDEGADLVVATSVFTHLLPDDAGPYFKEIARVLRPDGVAFVTAFIVDAAAAARLAAGRSPYAMTRLAGGVWATDVDAPEAGTGYDESRFLALAAHAGLESRDIRRGYWSEGDAGWNHQDALVLRRAR